jgi:methylphosphotriester-DNA--protein-cysteine methyltransferase
VFVDRLVRQGILVRDPVVEAAIRGHTPDTSVRSLQYRFSRATGLTHKTIRQIERARSAISLLEQGTPISDVALELGYFDQAHLATDCGVVFPTLACRQAPMANRSYGVCSSLQ